MRRGKRTSSNGGSRCFHSIPIAIVCSLIVLTLERLLAASGTPHMGMQQYTPTSKQRTLAEWHSSRRMHITAAVIASSESAASTEAAAAAVGGDAGSGDDAQKHWASFWASDTPAAFETLQSLRDQVSMAKYQQLQNDLEPQATAGLDVAMSDTLQQLSQQTQLGASQAWLKEQVTAEVFRVLDTLQHPPDCASARKLVCDVNKGCGWGCQLHHAVHCFTAAVALNRTLVLKTHPWRYAPRANGTETWNDLMEPVSSCTSQRLQNPIPPAIGGSGGLRENELEVSLGIVDRAKTPFEVPAMPPDVLQLVHLFNSRPEHWWVGVLASYIMRPSAQSLDRHAALRHSNSWASPIVGVHIRRTDKVTSREAKLHTVPEYLSHVERYCDLKLGPGWQQQAANKADAGATAAAETPQGGRTCSIYLATDEPRVVDEIRQNFAHINVITNPVALATGTVSKRNSVDGAQGIYDDSILLASTDYLVGTFSSQVSRLAYEVMLVNGSHTQPAVTDPSLHYHTVDSMWYFGGMLHYEWCTKHDFTEQGELVVEAGAHVECSAMHAFYEGAIKCSLLPDKSREVYLPPALLGRCQSPTQSPYRHLLPPYMQRTGAREQPQLQHTETE